jgi:hypothetical protein
MLFAIASVSVSAMAQSAGAGGMHGEIGVGRTSAGQLVAHMHFDQPVVIPRSVFPNITGFATSLVGFENVPLDDPGEDVLMLAANCDISVRLTSADPGAVIYSGLSPLAVGESMVFGPPFFDFHPIFNIPSPAATPGQAFAFRFVLHDAAGVYADSDEFTLAITASCPADFNLSGQVGVQDIFDYLAAYFANSPEADFNRAGGVSVQDIFDYLAAYFQPCP